MRAVPWTAGPHTQNAHDHMQNTETHIVIPPATPAAPPSAGPRQPHGRSGSGQRQRASRTAAGPGAKRKSGQTNSHHITSSNQTKSIKLHHARCLNAHHTSADPQAHTERHAHTHKHTHARARAHTHTHTHTAHMTHNTTQTRRCAHHTRADPPAGVRARGHTHAHTHIHTNKHTHVIHHITLPQPRTARSATLIAFHRAASSPTPEALLPSPVAFLPSTPFAERRYFAMKYLRSDIRFAYVE